ncbi:MAG: hypothetical protein C0503_08780 [Gemmatimonas sp.]|nr:hypothetical protein [Gemmatimonas sp.]
MSADRRPPREIDLARVRTIPVATRPNKVESDAFAKPPSDARGFNDFLDALPHVLKADDFRRVVRAVVSAHRRKRGVIVMLGGHVVKTGIAPLLIDLMKRGVITHLAMNGSAAIHDYEIARFGATSEDVAAGLKDGSFGMAEETGRGLNTAFTTGRTHGWGMGESVGRALAAEPKLVHPEQSVILAAHQLWIPVTVHAALGAEIIHQHPAADGAAIGDTSHRDFRRLAASCEDLHEGGVVLNLGSAVIMPEVFLKALTVARNVNAGRPTHFTTADFDMQRHYRPRENVVKRPVLAGGEGFEITGHHELMIPLLAWAIVEGIESKG